MLNRLATQYEEKKIDNEFSIFCLLGDWAVLDGDDVGFYIGFQRVPERKQGKNRLHLDVEVDDLDSAIDQAEQLGAGKVGSIVSDDDGSFQVMTDPGGNEFCFITG
jgi:predicted enzyme related to lactoylglutathione lyase